MTLDSIDRLRSSLDIFARRALEVDLSGWTREAMVKLAGKVDPGYVLRASGALPARMVTPGGYFGTAMVAMEYGEKARRALYHQLHKGGHRVRREGKQRKRQTTAKMAKDYINLTYRVQQDLPNWLLRQLGTLGGSKYKTFQAIFLESLKYLGLHSRGLDLVKAYMCTSKGSCQVEL